MNCNCNRQTTAIKWIRGNFFPYVLPITRHDTDGTVDSDGNLIWTVTDYQVMPEDEVSVVFKGSVRSYNMDFTIDANGHLVIEDNGEMPNGVYSIEVNITANNIDGMRRRWMIKDAVQLCESLTQEEMHATTLQADVFWFAKGDTGNGIEGVTLTDTVIDTETGQRTRTYTISFTDSEDVIITLTDIDFDIFMDKIIDLIGQVQVNVIPYITEGTKIANVAGTDIYSPSTPTYDEVPTSGSDNPVKSKGIKSAIDAETSRAQGAETSIEQLISNENLRARAAETSLQNNINSESQRAQQAESVNANAISDIQQELVNLDSRIPDSLADLSEDSTHRTVTDAEKTAWNGKVNPNDLATVATSGSYNDLSNKPTIPSAVTESTVSGWGFTKNTGTITGITMNGASKGTSGVVDLGTVITDISGKQDALVSGTNIKTINNESILGSGNITISGGGGGGGEANVIESISINGTAQAVTSKNVDLAVPVSSTITAIVTLTEAQYTALATKDSSTLYIITA